MSRELKQCPSCKLWTSNEDHICIKYDDSRPCEKCGAGTVFVEVAAPGIGSGRSCRNNHFVGKRGMLAATSCR